MRPSRKWSTRPTLGSFKTPSVKVSLEFRYFTGALASSCRSHMSFTSIFQQTFCIEVPNRFHLLLSVQQSFFWVPLDHRKNNSSDLLLIRILFRHFGQCSISALVVEFHWIFWSTFPCNIRSTFHLTFGSYFLRCFGAYFHFGISELYHLLVEVYEPQLCSSPSRTLISGLDCCFNTPCYWFIKPFRQRPIRPSREYSTIPFSRDSLGALACNSMFVFHLTSVSILSRSFGFFFLLLSINVPWEK